MKVLRNRLLVTLVFAAIVLAFASGAALASLRSSGSAAVGTSVSQDGRPSATLSSGEPDVGGVPAIQRGMVPARGSNHDGAWWTWISRIWASWSLRVVR